MAIFMQVINLMKALDPKSTNAHILLALAERMMEKADIKEFEQVRLYLAILDLLKKYQEAIGLLQGPLGALCKVKRDRERLMVDFLEKQKSWEQVKLKCMALLEEK